MESKQNKPLTDEERAAVEKAMAEFGENSFEWNPSAPKKQKKTAAPKPVLQISPLVRNLLLAAGLLVLLVGLLTLILGGGEQDPSPAVPEITPTSKLPTVIVVRPTDGTVSVVPPTDDTEPPTEVPVPPDTQPSQPIESTPPVTVPPTEPPVELPEGTPVSSEELSHLQTLFSGYSVYASMSRYRFTDPTTIGLQALTAADIRPDSEMLLSEQELNYLSQISDSYLYLDVCILPKYEAEEILQQYYGLKLEDVPSAKDAVFWARTNCFYFIEEAYRQDLTVTHAVTLPGGNIWVRYVDAFNGKTGQMILSETGEYHILSNTID